LRSQIAISKCLCTALRDAGVEVWFDQAELRGGDEWDAKIRKQIRECALFVPVISANTQARRAARPTPRRQFCNPQCHQFPHPGGRDALVAQGGDTLERTRRGVGTQLAAGKHASTESVF
jgi:hypothetical protein